MQGPEFDNELIEVGEDEEEVNPYTTWVTIAGLILAISMLGSLILRAFPPHVIFNSFSDQSGANALEYPVAVRVEADAGWLDTEIDLASNSGYRLSARGQVLLSDQESDGEPIGPGGLSSRCQPTEESTCALDDAPLGALVGRVDMGEPFMVGNLQVLDVVGSGRLWLAVNDRLDSYGDNEGYFVVRLEPFDSSRFDTALARPDSHLK